MVVGNRTKDGPHSFVELVGKRGMIIVAWVLFALTLIAFVYGVTSWCLIKKFRHFRNYVILSAITAGLLRLVTFQIGMSLITRDIVLNYPVVPALVASTMTYFSLSFNCWLLVLCYIFYVDFVKVFRLDIHRRYLKIVYSLFRSNDKGANKPFNKWTRFYISTLTFVLSNIIVLAAVIDFFQLEILIVDVIGELGEYLNKVALNVYIIIVKVSLWNKVADIKGKNHPVISARLGERE
ncbi:hypothetical protein SFRURICE_016005 [Spodoptera frugiperda]|nr:hypothetical protein SFRURICE_016005 [Spodoptera frugiperda]